MNDTVGIIIRTKNRPVFLRRALKSVQEQTFGRWKIVLVNDGGEPGIVESIVASMPESTRQRIELLHHAESVGRSEAGNAGFRALDTDHIAVLDDDDTWHPAFLETCMQTLADVRGRVNTVKGVAARLHMVSEKIVGGRVDLLEVSEFRPEISHPDILSLDEMLRENFLGLCGVVLDRQAVIAAGGLFSRDLSVFEDWDLYLRLMTRWDIAGIEERLANYHFRFSETDSDLGNCVVAQQADMLLHRQMLLNRWLRQSLQTRGHGQYANARRHFVTLANQDAALLNTTAQSIDMVKDGLIVVAKTVMQMQERLSVGH